MGWSSAFTMHAWPFRVNNRCGRAIVVSAYTLELLMCWQEDRSEVGQLRGIGLDALFLTYCLVLLGVEVLVVGSTEYGQGK